MFAIIEFFTIARLDKRLGTFNLDGTKILAFEFRSRAAIANTNDVVNSDIVEMFQELI